MWRRMVLIMLGLCFGNVTAWGATAFLVSLGILPRYAGITRTAEKMYLYEHAAVLGILAGTAGSFGRVVFPLGRAGLVAAGVFAGIFVGSWIVALGEVLNIFPALIKKCGLRKSTGLLIISIALGKVSGSLLYFGKGWWKI